jgi:hypothetical protein
VIQPWQKIVEHFGQIAGVTGLDKHIVQFSSSFLVVEDWPFDVDGEGLDVVADGPDSGLLVFDSFDCDEPICMSTNCALST